MKSISSFVLLSFLISSLALAFSNTDIFEDISFAIKSGNSRELSKYFGSRVELSINDNENIYSKTQAEVILKEFFDKNPPTNFKIINKGASNKGLPYIIGELETASSKFRTYILFKNTGGQNLIQELQFDKQ